MNVTEILYKFDTCETPEEKWECVLACFDTVAPSQQAQAISALSARLNRLPDDIRRAPPRWVHGAIKGAPAYRLGLARSIHVRARDTRDRRNAINDKKMQTFVTIAELRSIQRLKLFFCGLSDYGVTLLASCQYLSNLKFLNLVHNHLTHTGALAILKSRNLGQLSELHLSRNHIGDYGAKQIADCTKGVCLDVLALRDCGLTSKGIHLLEQSPSLQDCSLYF
ncbi:MAG: hypothetical protein AAGD25_29875 [Cyanobacteria bacterium P01_F01_bin.150]